MRAFVVSDLETVGASVRNGLLRLGYDCPSTHVIGLDIAAQYLGRVNPELVVAALGSDPNRALAMLAELRPQTKASILAIGPTADARLVLRTLRGGADEYLDEADLEGELEAGVGRCKQIMVEQRLDYLAKCEVESGVRRGKSGGTAAGPGRVLAVLAPNGGSGASTLAVNLAAALAREHKGALLIDLKLETGDLATLLDLKPTYTLADLCQHLNELDRTLFERSLATHANGVRMLAPPRALADVGYVTAEGVRQALTLGASLFPFVVVDVDHTFREEQAQALRQADIVLLVLRLDFICLRNTRRTLDYLTSLGVGAERVRLVVNRYGQAKEVPAAKAEQALGGKFNHYIPEDAATINRANNNGIPAVLDSPSARVCRSMTQLARSLDGVKR